MKLFPLGDLTPETFLRDYWQKKPLLIRQAFPGIRSPLNASQLFELSTQENVESRLVLEEGGDSSWQVEHGPFSRTYFDDLPDSNWSLLIQDVDKFCLAAAEILDHFQFIPSWRIDDLMISFAPDKGSVGPHRDEYDVFLIQAEGRRHWHLSELPTDQDIWLQNVDLNVLDNFESTTDWLMEPGDMLYLPPQLAHHGIASGDCITLSVGFRSPSDFELFSAYSDHRYDTLNNHEHYSDAMLRPTTQPGQIPLDSINTLKQHVIAATIGKENELQHWLACYLTEQKDNIFTELPEQSLSTEEFSQNFSNTRYLHRSLKTRMAWLQENNKIALYANGMAYATGNTPAILIETLSSQRRSEAREFQRLEQSSDTIALLTRLYNDGHISLEQ